jgi:hypothetical protein
MLRAWSFDGGNHRVTCTLPVLDQISSAARDGFLSFRHGGMEIGGILVGSKRATLTQIVDARPLAIGHGRGAQFLLTDEDHRALEALIRNTNAEFETDGLEVVGCYESRTRRDSSTAGVESETFAMHFPAPRQVCLILKPGREDVASVLAYVRDEQANVIPATSVEDVADVNVEREAPIASEPVIAAPVSQPVTDNVPDLASESVHAMPVPASKANDTYDVPQMYVSPRANPKWKYAAAGALAIAVGVGSVSMLRDRGDQPPPPTERLATPIPAPNPLPPPPAQPVAANENSSAAAAPALTQRARAKPKVTRSKRVRQRSKKTRRSLPKRTSLPSVMTASTDRPLSTGRASARASQP